MSKHNWNVSIIEEKIKEKIHERGGGTGHYQVLVSYTIKEHNTATATAPVHVLFRSVEQLHSVGLLCVAH
jgi:hypothetical protein